MQVVTMTKKSPRWGSLCHHCGQRIRMDRFFVVDEVNSQNVRHLECHKKSKGIK